MAAQLPSVFECAVMSAMVYTQHYDIRPLSWDFHDSHAQELVIGHNQKVMVLRNDQKKCFIVAIMGTDSIEQVIKDVQFMLNQAEEMMGYIKIILEKINSCIGTNPKYNSYALCFTGHSLGGIYAQLCTKRILKLGNLPVPRENLRCFTYEAPGCRHIVRKNSEFFGTIDEEEDRKFISNYNREGSILTGGGGYILSGIIRKISNNRDHFLWETIGRNYVIYNARRDSPEGFSETLRAFGIATVNALFVTPAQMAQGAVAPVLAPFVNYIQNSMGLLNIAQNIPANMIGSCGSVCRASAASLPIAITEQKRLHSIINLAIGIYYIYENKANVNIGLIGNDTEIWHLRECLQWLPQEDISLENEPIPDFLSRLVRNTTRYYQERPPAAIDLVQSNRHETTFNTSILSFLVAMRIQDNPDISAVRALRLQLQEQLPRSVFVSNPVSAVDNRYAIFKQAKGINSYAAGIFILAVLLKYYPRETTLVLFVLCVGGILLRSNKNAAYNNQGDENGVNQNLPGLH